MKEQWKDILGYQKLYQISNKGRVKSLNRKVLTKGRRFREVKQKILTSGKNKYGYVQISLSKKGIRKCFRIHRIVAKHFCENYSEQLQVNHLDGNKLNNEYSNLECCTASENMLHAYATGLIIPPRNRLGFSGKLHKDSMAVLQLTLDGKLIKKFDSIGLTKVDGFTPTHVHKCCRGKLKTHKKFKWAFKES